MSEFHTRSSMLSTDFIFSSWISSFSFSASASRVSSCWLNSCAAFSWLSIEERACSANCKKTKMIYNKRTQKTVWCLYVQGIITCFSLLRDSSKLSTIDLYCSTLVVVLFRRSFKSEFWSSACCKCARSSSTSCWGTPGAATANNRSKLSYAVQKTRNLKKNMLFTKTNIILTSLCLPLGNVLTGGLGVVLWLSLLFSCCLREVTCCSADLSSSLDFWCSVVCVSNCFLVSKSLA